jgi:hypothetical protein
MLRAILTAFAFSLIVAGCPGVDLPGGVDVPPVAPPKPPETGDPELYHDMEMLCLPPADTVTPVGPTPPVSP